LDSNEKNNYPYKYEKLKKEQVVEWLSLASNRKFNIFHDKNEVIYLLCNEILKNWKEE
jgi:hypothetical protein